MFVPSDNLQSQSQSLQTLIAFLVDKILKTKKVRNKGVAPTFTKIIPDREIL